MSDLDSDVTLRGFRPGQKVFDRYVIQKMLGRGGMGVVWLARDEELEIDLALKFLPEVIAMDQQAVDDLKRETRRSLQLTHPHIVRIYDFIQDGRTAAIAMEYVNGNTLAGLKIDKPDRSFAPDEIRDWLIELAEALHYAHTRAEVVHRDLKPANLMVDRKDGMKIADFGIAASVSDSVSRVSAQAGSSGTPVYMSPQQMMGEKPAVSDDVYSFGATLYDLLTSKPPFHSGNIIAQVQAKVPPSMRERRSEFGLPAANIPAAWEELVAACLSKDPEARPRSMTEVLERLKGTTASPAPAPLPAPPAPPAKAEMAPGPVAAPPRRWIPISVAISLATLCVSAGYYYLAIYQPEQIALAEAKARAEELARQQQDLERKKAQAAAEETAHQTLLGKIQALPLGATKEQQALIELEVNAYEAMAPASWKGTVRSTWDDWKKQDAAHREEIAAQQAAAQKVAEVRKLLEHDQIDQLLLAARAMKPPPESTVTGSALQEAANDLKSSSAPENQRDAAMYLQLVKASLVDPENHGGWPYRFTLVQDPDKRAGIVSGLKVFRESVDSPILVYAQMWPALLLHDEEKVGAYISELKGADPFLHQQAIQRVAGVREYLAQQEKGAVDRKFLAHADLDRLLEGARSGKGAPSVSETQAAIQTARQETDSAKDVTEEAKAAAHYVLLVKASLIDDKNHGGWPFRYSSLFNEDERNALIGGLAELQGTTHEPIVTYSQIWPALVVHDEAKVGSYLESLKGADPFLFKKATEILPNVRSYFANREQLVEKALKVIHHDALDRLLAGARSGNTAPDGNITGTAMGTAIQEAQANASSEAQKEAGSYLVYVKASLIDAINHGGWPYRIDSLRDAKRKSNLIAGLKGLENLTHDPVVTYSRIWPSLMDKDEPTVTACLKTLKGKDDFLYQRASAALPDIRAYFVRLEAALNAQKK